MGSWGKDRFEFIKLEDLTSTASTQDCLAYEKVLADWFAAETDPAKKEVLFGLQTVFGLHLKHEQQGPHAFFGQEAIAEFDTDFLAAAVEFFDASDDDELKARILDAAWQRRACGHEKAKEAVHAYIRIAKKRLDLHHWPWSYDRLLRATNLAARLGSRGSNPFLSEVILELRELLRTHAPGDPLYFSAKLSDLIAEHEPDAAPECATLMEQSAQSLDDAGDHHRAFDYYESAADAWRAARQEEPRKRVLAASANSKIKLAKQEETSQPLVSAHHIEDAIAIFRSIGDPEGRVPELLVRHRELQKAGVNAMQSFATKPVDLSDCVKQAKDAVRGKPAMDALLGFVSFHHPTSKEDIRSAVIESRRDSVFRTLIPMRKLTTTGLTSVVTDPLGKNEEWLEEHMFEHATLLQSVVVRGGILAALPELQLDHALTKTDFFRLCQWSAFVPEGRAISFAQGLVEGFWGDFWAAAHLLVPQVENALRSALAQRGVPTASLPASGIQNEMTLNQVLDHPELTKLLGEDVVFDLQTLLAEKGGSNLRHAIAHGLISDGERPSTLVYFWWVTLRLVVLWQGLTKESAESPEPPTEGERGDG